MLDLALGAILDKCRIISNHIIHMRCREGHQICILELVSAEWSFPKDWQAGLIACTCCDHVTHQPHHVSHDFVWTHDVPAVGAVLSCQAISAAPALIMH